MSSPADAPDQPADAPDQPADGADQSGQADRSDRGDRGDRGGRPGAARLLVALGAGGAMLWAATAAPGGWGVGVGADGRPDQGVVATEGPTAAEDATADGTTSTGGAGDAAAIPPAESLVRSATLTCAGVGDEPARDGAGAQGATDGVRVRAATAPADLLPPAGEDAVGARLEILGSDRGQEVAGGGGTASLDLVGQGVAGVTAGPGSAPGLTAAQLEVVTEPGRQRVRGAALTPCAAPAEVVHLVGGGSGAGRAEEVVVVNPGADPVTVDLEVWGADGPVPLTGGRGLVVAPGERQAHLLDALARGVEAPAVRVRSSGGPVAAYLVDQDRDGTTDLGREGVAPAAAPGRDLVIPGVPTTPGPEAGEGPRELVLRVLAPEKEAVVEIRALTQDGVLTPGTPVVRVPAGATVDVPLEDLPGPVVGLRLRSDAPVTAAALVRIAPSGQDPLDEEVATAGPDDEAAATRGPDDAVVTSAPDDAAATRGPDDAAATRGPDDAAATTGPVPGERSRPLVHPAGELAWVAAVPLTTGPLGIAVPSVDELPGAQVVLGLSAVDGTEGEVRWLADDGTSRAETFTLRHDSSTTLDVPEGTAAVWVRATGAAGVAAALHITGADRVGPYLAATALPALPWTRELVAVTPVVP